MLVPFCPLQFCLQFPDAVISYGAQVTAALLWWKGDHVESRVLLVNGLIPNQLPRNTCKIQILGGVRGEGHDTVFTELPNTPSTHHMAASSRSDSFIALSSAASSSARACSSVNSTTSPSCPNFSMAAACAMLSSISTSSSTAACKGFVPEGPDGNVEEYGSSVRLVSMKDAGGGERGRGKGAGDLAAAGLTGGCCCCLDWWRADSGGGEAGGGEAGGGEAGGGEAGGVP